MKMAFFQMKKSWIKITPKPSLATDRIWTKTAVLVAFTFLSTGAADSFSCKLFSLQFSLSHFKTH